MPTDIQSRSDIEMVINRFYAKVQTDDLLAPFFQALDWDHHLPIMYKFWSSMLLGEKSYSGNPFQRHLNLPLESRHFNQWLKLFEGTVDECFQGPGADEIKTRARSIAGIFQYKMGITPEE